MNDYITACPECGHGLPDPLAKLRVASECSDEDREFEARTILAQRGVYLDLRPFTLDQIEALAEVVKTWGD